MANNKREMTIIGAGPVGCLLASILADRGYEVVVYEKRSDLREVEAGGGRSINLVLTNRGLRALDLIGLRAKVLELTVPVLGRMMHDIDGEFSYHAYGKDDSECNYSVSREGLNGFLLDAAEERGVKFHFETPLVGADFEGHQIEVESEGVRRSEEFDMLFGCDGAPSALRRAMVEKEVVEEDVEMMRWGYKELVFPAGDENSYAMAGHALHIWPRGHHFLMGLANLDGSFTGTIYLPREGAQSFDELGSAEEVRSFFEKYYGDAVGLLGDFVDEFLTHPVGNLGTVRSSPWHLGGRVLLLGDASHGIVPFFGQGLNSGFEDGLELVELMEEFDDFSIIFERFFEKRKPDAEAIADMALENFVEMSEKVGDTQFLFQKKVESILESHLSELYRSRYAMVMYSAIPYGVAFEIGEVQMRILGELSAGLDEPHQVDLERARELIVEHLVPIYERRGVDLCF